MTYSNTTIWLIILGLGLGTYLIRFSFFGFLGQRPLPEWAMRLLRYTPVAVLPGLVAPLILWPAATGGSPDPARLAAAAVTFAVALITRNVLWAIPAGLATLYLMLATLG